MPFFGQHLGQILHCYYFVAPLDRKSQITVVQPSLLLHGDATPNYMIVPVPLSRPEQGDRPVTAFALPNNYFMEDVRNCFGSHTSLIMQQSHQSQRGSNRIAGSDRISSDMTVEYGADSIEVVERVQDLEGRCNARMLTLLSRFYPEDAYQYVVARIDSTGVQQPLAICHSLVGETLFLPTRLDPFMHMPPPVHHMEPRLAPDALWDVTLFAVGSIDYLLNEPSVLYDLMAEPGSLVDFKKQSDWFSGKLPEGLSVPVHFNGSHLRCIRVSGAFVNADLWLRTFYQLSSSACTYDVAAGRYVMQEWYHCVTCGLVGDGGCCANCRWSCHKGHDTHVAGISYFYCDCGGPRLDGEQYPKLTKCCARVLPRVQDFS